MSQIKSKGTKLENEFIEYLSKCTDKPYQRNVTNIKGTPDIVFKNDRGNSLCIFIDSDFWHGYPLHYFLRKEVRQEKLFIAGGKSIMKGSVEKGLKKIKRNDFKTI